MGDQRLAASSPNKDFIFLTGESNQYSLNTPTNNNNQGTLINTLESLNITFTNGKSISGSNGIDNIIYGNGTSHAVANKTPASSITENITKSTTTLSVDINVSLVSADEAHMLTSIILTAAGGLPDNIIFKGEGLTNVSYADGSYTLTFEPGTTDFNGSMTVTFPGDTASLGGISLTVDSNAGELGSNSFTFDSESGLEYESSTLDSELTLQSTDVYESDHNAELAMSADQHSDHYEAEHTEDVSLPSTEETDQSTSHDASETVDNIESPDGQEHLGSESLAADDNTHTDSDTHNSATFVAEHESLDTSTDEPNLNPIQLETTSSDTELNLLVDNIGDDHSEWNLSHDENSGASNHINHSDYSVMVDNGEPLALEDIISDESHQDSPDHLLPQASPVPVDYADNAGSEPSEGTDNSWVSHDTSQVEDLIAKPEVES
ncbi:hypothetical protein EB837_18340 [Kluyvera ascorbata]|uniref:Uncharacterized protein n=1 Tax=Kluyvera ascorbata TaxID=51288 RepID=A0A3N2RWC1_9ENTR|nr:hypothetical protein [Kluyvera ascorbata]ROU11621.1 hypothetical protein EB837_18340 [Kluyvera ascorbata]